MKSILDNLYPSVVIHGHRYFAGDKFINDTGMPGSFISIDENGGSVYEVQGTRGAAKPDATWVVIRPR